MIIEEREKEVDYSKLNHHNIYYKPSFVKKLVTVAYSLVVEKMEFGQTNHFFLPINITALY